MGQEREREDGDREVENSPEIYGRLLWSTDWITEGETRWIIHEDTGPCMYVCVTCWWHTHTNVSQAALGQLIYEERGRQATNNVWTVTIISKNKNEQGFRNVRTAVLSSYWMWSLIQMWKHINNIRLVYDEKIFYLLFFAYITGKIFPPQYVTLRAWLPVISVFFTELETLNREIVGWRFSETQENIGYCIVK